MKRSLKIITLSIILITLSYSNLFSIAIENSNKGANSPNASSLTWTHDIGVSGNLLVVFASAKQDGITRITANNGTTTYTLTIVPGCVSTASQLAGGGANAMYYVDSPTNSKTYTIVVTYSGGNDDVAAQSVSFTGVDVATGPFCNSAIKNHAQSTTAPASSFTTCTVNDVIIDCFANLTNAASTKDANQALIASFGSGNHVHNAVSIKVPACVCNGNTMDWTLSSLDDWAISAIVLKANTALPIKLLNFNAVFSKKVVTLNWASAVELNNKY